MAEAARALIIVDVQNDFCEGGSLAVPGGAEVARRISEHVAAAAEGYAAIVATADWHEDPGGHWSPDPDYSLSWPVHCRVGSGGADFHPALGPALEQVEATFRKGQHTAAYSGFEGHTLAADGTAVMLVEWLRRRGVVAVDVAGIATDYCVRATALDAIEARLATRVLLPLTAGVAPQTTAAALTDLRAAGVRVEG